MESSSEFWNHLIYVNWCISFQKTANLKGVPPSSRKTYFFVSKYHDNKKRRQIPVKVRH